MISISTLEISGFYGAILGMRNPFKNRDKSDSFEKNLDSEWGDEIGPKDLELCQKLLRMGKDDDAKFMRMIHVQADVNAPLYWWKEMDQYKVATVTNSESTMHTIAQREFTIDDFSHDQLISKEMNSEEWCTDEEAINVEMQEWYPIHILGITVQTLNQYRKLYLETKNKKYWYNMIQLLPSSYMQKRTIDLNYQTLRRIYFARRNHKLNEWHTFCDWIKTLDYGEELITYAPGICDNVSYVGGSDASN